MKIIATNKYNGSAWCYTFSTKYAEHKAQQALIKETRLLLENEGYNPNNFNYAVIKED